MNALEQELAFFEEHNNEWAVIHPNKFVLVKDQELIGSFDTAEAAITEGAKRFGSTAFLVRQLNRTQGEVFIPALCLGLLYAHS